MVRNLTQERILTVHGLPVMFLPVLRYSLAPTVHRYDMIAMLKPRLHLNPLPLKLKWINNIQYMVFGWCRKFYINPLIAYWNVLSAQQLVHSEFCLVIETDPAGNLFPPPLWTFPACIPLHLLKCLPSWEGQSDQTPQAKVLCSWSLLYVCPPPLLWVLDTVDGDLQREEVLQYLDAWTSKRLWCLGRMC